MDILQTLILPVLSLVWPALLLTILFFLLPRSSVWAGGPVRKYASLMGVTFGVGIVSFFLFGSVDRWEGPWKYTLLLAAMFGYIRFFSALFDWLYTRVTGRSD